MNEIEAQKLFNQKRRQHFLSEYRANRFHDYFKEAIPVYAGWKISDDLATRFLFRQQAGTYWDYLRLCYTAGNPISELPPLLDEIINVLEITTAFWWEHETELRKEGYYCGPMPWFYVEYYQQTLQLISFCYLLQREDLLERLLQIILDNAKGGLEPDSTIEDFFYYRFKNRDDPNYVQFGEYAALLSNAMRDDDRNEQLRYLDAYLKDWYKEMTGMNDSEYNSHLDPEQNGFCGYWAFEAAAVAYLDDLDDSSFYQYPYYPKDMVQWAREQRRIRYAQDDTENALPLLLAQGKTALFAGKYGVDNFSGFERVFAVGDILPAGQVSGKRDGQGNPVYCQDTVWRLLTRDDQGPTRFSQNELEHTISNKRNCPNVSGSLKHWGNHIFFCIMLFFDLKIQRLD